MKFPALSLLPLVLCTSLVAQNAPSAPPAGAPAKRNVSVIVSVTDHGNPVQELPKNRLSVSDNGLPGEVQDVRPVTQLPLHLAIVLKASKTNFGQQQAAAIELAKRLVRPDVDKVFVITAGGEKLWPNPRIEWQTNPDAAEKVIKDLDKNTGVPDAFNYSLSSVGAGQTRMELQQYAGGGLSAFDVVWMMMKTDPRPARRAVVMFRDAWAHSPGQYLDQSKLVDERHAAIIGDAQQLWAAFYMIGLEQASSAPGELSRTYSPNDTGAGGALRVYDQEMDKFRDRAYSAGRSNVERMALETGGGAWWSTKKNYSDAVTGIVNQLNSQFAVTYAVNNSAPVAVHQLRVKGSDASLRISAQKVYFSRQAAEQSANTNTPK